MVGAQQNIHLVDIGKSVHNVQYSASLLDAAYGLLGEAVRQVAPQASLPAFASATELPPSECANCHFGVEEVTAERYGVLFKHSVHVVENQMECTVCHSNMRTHGELIATKEKCTTCHHRKQSIDCAQCHTLQVGGIRGKTAAFSEEVPGVMA